MSRKFTWFITMLVAVALLAACVPTAAAPSANQAIPRQINANGVGKVYLTPDVAYVNIGVRSQSENVGDALKGNSAQAQSVVDALKELGVDAKDIQTSAFNVYPQQEFGPNGEVIKNTYVVENTVYITVRDMTKLGQLLDTVVRSGANTINGLQFDVLDKSKATSEARRLAIEDARKQAQEMADAAGVKLGALLSLNSYLSSPPVPVFEGKGGAQNNDKVPVSAGQLVLTVEASLAYEIAQ